MTMWDNRMLSHKGIADETLEKRVVQRVTVRGASPMNHAGEQFSETHKTKSWVWSKVEGGAGFWNDAAPAEAMPHSAAAFPVASGR